MKIVNLFCDASIDTRVNIACGGCFITLQELNPIGSVTNGNFTSTVFDMDNAKDFYSKMYIQHNATNNSAEILAIWTAITEILKIREMYPNAVYRIFADSKISLYGLRDWIKRWIAQYDPEEGILRTSSGDPVANQQYFIDIYDMIIDFNIHVELYHQRGHVGESGKVKTEASRVHFIKANKVTPEMLGLSMNYLNRGNHIIDNLTRDSLRDYIDRGILRPDTELELINPFIMYPRADKLDVYINNINKTSVSSRHNFRNGYSQ